jgi:hypothetical protein
MYPPRDRSAGPASYGKHYWRVYLANGKTVYAFADRVFAEHGALRLISADDEGGMTEVVLMVAPGQWRACFPVAPEDGRPLALDPRDRDDPMILEPFE